ncbi:hypothetical protein E2C01_082052 [Portunus trituberculatus]|uniref:Uncharacterized protein n=1 Tax=Portunus trituberculatus TaxID=210409 RepID=A0A5B7IZR8_PORTR|nr:hypothetical protein [Portunus trituberculatus]
MQKVFSATFRSLGSARRGGTGTHKTDSSGLGSLCCTTPGVRRQDNSAIRKGKDKTVLKYFSVASLMKFNKSRL